MSRQHIPAVGRVSRRSALGLLGAAPLAASGAVALSPTASAATTANGASPGSIPPAFRPGGSFDQLLAQQAANGHWFGTVLVAYRGRPVLTRSYGMANIAKNIPNKTDTIFGLASLGKLITATAVIQLVAQGKLDLGKTLGSYLPGFPADIAKITVHQLLTHTSGMGDYTQSPAFKKQAPTWTSAEETINGIMDIIKDAKLLFTPGTKTSYSNSGFATLGSIVGRVTGKSYVHYYDYVRANIFAPAGMTRTDFYPAPQRAADPRIAQPYVTAPDGALTSASGQNAFVGTGAGGACSTAPDMIRFARALSGDRLLSRPWVELLISPKGPGTQGPPKGAQGPSRGRERASDATPPPAPGHAFGGYGCLPEILNNRRLVSMSGGTVDHGEDTTLDMFPDLDWDAVFLSNHNAGNTGALFNAERQAITERAR